MGVSSWLTRKNSEDKKPTAQGESSPRTEIKGRSKNIGVSADTTLMFRKDLFDLGREAAHTAGDTRVNERRLESLQEHAIGMAREQIGSMFDTSSAHDRLQEEKYEGAKAKLPEVESSMGLAEQDVRKSRNALAEVGDKPDHPRVPWLFIIIATLLISATVAPTFHDFFFSTLPDAQLAWLLSILPGLAAGLTIAYTLLATFESTSGHRMLHIVGLSGGVVFSLAVGLIRLVGVHSERGIILTLGLTLLEIAIVLLLEFMGQGLRKRFHTFITHKQIWDRQARILQAAQDDLTYWTTKHDELSAIIADHIELVGDREVRARQAEALMAAAKQVVTDGYLQGLDENEAKLRGRSVVEVTR